MRPLSGRRRYDCFSAWWFKGFLGAGALCEEGDISISDLSSALYLVASPGGNHDQRYGRWDSGPDFRWGVRERSAFVWLDYAFNNAGISGENQLLTDQTEKTFDHVFAVNVKALFLLLQDEDNRWWRRGMEAQS
jgi:NAD(P)-dependent dehydrogenase (short-subunit alcohol dehydrogenase family)